MELKFGQKVFVFALWEFQKMNHCMHGHGHAKVQSLYHAQRRINNEHFADKSVFFLVQQGLFAQVVRTCTDMTPQAIDRGMELAMKSRFQHPAIVCKAAGMQHFHLDVM
jgi:hypothetical protein